MLSLQSFLREGRVAGPGWEKLNTKGPKCNLKGRRALLPTPSTEGRSVCLWWAPSKPKGPEGRQSTLEVIPLRPTNRPTLIEKFVLHIPNDLILAAGFAPGTAIIKCVHGRSIIIFVLDALLMTSGS